MLDFRHLDEVLSLLWFLGCIFSFTGMRGYGRIMIVLQEPYLRLLGHRGCILVKVEEGRRK